MSQEEAISSASAATSDEGVSAPPPQEQDVTVEGTTAVELESSMAQKLAQAIHLSRAEGRHSEAADILGDLIKVA